MTQHYESCVRSFNADPMASLRLAWLVKLAQERMGLKVTQSAVIRRALHHYQGHMDVLSIEGTDESKVLERFALTQALSNHPSPIRPERVTQGHLEGFSLSGFIRQATAQEPSAQERLWSELDKWSSRIERRHSQQ